VPKYIRQRLFQAEYARLSAANQLAFKEAVMRFVVALKEGRLPDPGLGIRQMTNHPGIYEFHYSRSGRATFHYGSADRGPDALVVWRRIGGHEIYRKP
jgi:hypothetical protein